MPAILKANSLLLQQYQLAEQAQATFSRRHSCQQTAWFLVAELLTQQLEEHLPMIHHQEMHLSLHSLAHQKGSNILCL